MIALMITQFGNLFTGNISGVPQIIGLICAVIVLVGMIYMLVRPYKEATTLKREVKIKEKVKITK